MALLWSIVFVLTLPMNPPTFTALLLKLRKGEATASITREAHPKNHNYLTYQYVIDGETLRGVGYGPNGNMLKVGDQVPVCYFPAHPQYATIATYSEQAEFLRDGVMVGIVMATFATFLVYWKYFRATRQEKNIVPTKKAKELT